MGPGRSKVAGGNVGTGGKDVGGNIEGGGKIPGWNVGIVYQSCSCAKGVLAIKPLTLVGCWWLKLVGETALGLASEARRKELGELWSLLGKPKFLAGAVNPGAGNPPGAA